MRVNYDLFLLIVLFWRNNSSSVAWSPLDNITDDTGDLVDTTSSHDISSPESKLSSESKRTYNSYFEL
jgi:hypothetical protein